LADGETGLHWTEKYGFAASEAKTFAEIA
jgi:hypothetical protein